MSEQRERGRKQAAASCQRIDSLFAPAAKRSKESSSEQADVDVNSQNFTVSSQTESKTQGQCSSNSSTCSTAADSIFCGENPALPVNSSKVHDVEDVPRNETVSLHVDIGDVVAECSSEENVHLTLKNLPNEQKYSPLKHHSRPAKEFVFPSPHIAGCNRSF